MQKLSWKEKFAGILVLFFAIIYLLMQIASLLSNTSQAYAMQQEALVINKNELFSDVRAYIVIIMGLIAGPLLLKSKTTGWVLGLPLLLLFAIFFLVLGVQAVVLSKGQVDASVAFLGSGFLLPLLAIIFLFLPSAREKYRASKSIVLLTLLLFVAMGGLYYFLQ